MNWIDLIWSDRCKYAPYDLIKPKCEAPGSWHFKPRHGLAPCGHAGCGAGDAPGPTASTNTMWNLTRIFCDFCDTKKRLKTTNIEDLHLDIQKLFTRVHQLEIRQVCGGRGHSASELYVIKLEKSTCKWRRCRWWFSMTLSCVRFNTITCCINIRVKLLPWVFSDVLTRVYTRNYTNLKEPLFDARIVSVKRNNWFKGRWKAGCWGQARALWSQCSHGEQSKSGDFRSSLGTLDRG